MTQEPHGKRIEWLDKLDAITRTERAERAAYVDCQWDSILAPHRGAPPRLKRGATLPLVEACRFPTTDNGNTLLQPACRQAGAEAWRPSINSRLKGPSKEPS